VPVGKYSSLLYYIVSCRFEKKTMSTNVIWNYFKKSESFVRLVLLTGVQEIFFVFSPWFVACIIVTVTLTVNKIVINNWFRLRPKSFVSFGLVTDTAETKS